MQRTTLTTLLVLTVLQGDERYGLEVCRRTGLTSGTVYPILDRLEREGWIEGTWERPEIQESERRPRRRYYRLTPTGRVEARKARLSLDRHFLQAKGGD